MECQPVRPPLFFLWRTRTIMSLNGWVAGELSSPLDPAPRRTRRTVRSDLLEREGPDYETVGWMKGQGVTKESPQEAR